MESTSWVQSPGGGFRVGHLCLLYTDNHVKPICSLVNGQGGAAGGINDFRQIAGGSDNHGFILVPAETPFYIEAALGINNSGQII
jgi:hypothetical protein